LVFTCVHRRTRAHLSYAGSADWIFALEQLPGGDLCRTTAAA
jgi:hypothetical protein